MEVTGVRVRGVAGEQKVKANASVTFDDSFVVHELRVVEGPHGLFISMPARRTLSGAYRDLAHPVTAACREMIQQAVLQAYETWTRERQVQTGGGEERLAAGA